MALAAPVIDSGLTDLSALAESPDQTGPAGPAGGLVVAGESLSLGEVEQRLRAAGFREGDQTVRRMIDEGDFGAEGEGWYRTRGGHRRVYPAAVEAYLAGRREEIARRQAGPSVQPPD